MSPPYIDRAIVDHVAKLARLSLTEAECGALVDELAHILDAFAQLAELDLTGVEPTAQVAPVHERLCEDAVRLSLPRDAVLAAATAAEEGFFTVPPVLEPA